MHWADVLAEELLERGQQHVLATAITPSGPIHVGNMREVLTADAVYRALRDRDADARLLYIGDTYDPLRKVYPFLDEDTYAEHVGKPLSEIPAPHGNHDSYADAFLTPFLEDLEELGIHPDVHLAHEMYQDGTYLDATKRALENTPTIKTILEKVSGRDLPDNWIPFNPISQFTGRFDTVEVLLYEWPLIEYRDTETGQEGVVDVRDPGVGKLPWRVDWPARWDFLDVTFEAFGKDHAASGGSWDTGQEIATEVFGIDPPHHTVYEFIQLKGEGAMHSSTGTAVSAREMLHMTPPEVLRFLLMRYQPNRHIDFDPGFGVLELVEEYDRWEAAYFEDEADPDMKELQRVIELSQPHDVPGHQPAHVSHKHLVTLVQLAGELDEVTAILQRSGDLPEDPDPTDLERLANRVDHARYWVEHFAPEGAVITLQDEPPVHVLRDLTSAQRAFATTYADAIEDGPWTPDALHDAVYEAAEEHDLNVGKAFQTIYKAFLATKRGPRAGFFLSSLNPEFVVQRLRAAAKTD